MKNTDKIAVLSLAKAINPTERNNRTQNIINEIFQDIGFEAIFYPSCFEQEYLNCPTISSRINNFHKAIKDTDIKAIMIVRGGRNSNQLLSHIDLKIIKKYPKPIIGYSDITTILNAIYHKTGNLVYHGPMVIDFLKNKYNNTKLESLKIALNKQETRLDFSQARTIQKGEAKGVLIGGNITSFMNLTGTEYSPDLNNKIIFLEDTLNTPTNTRDRALHHLSLQKGANNISGILLAKTGEGHKITTEIRQKMFSQIPAFHNIPILANLNFGHLQNAETLILGSNFNFIAQ